MDITNNFPKNDGNLDNSFYFAENIQVIFGK